MDKQQDQVAIPLVRAAAEAAVGYQVMRDLVTRQKVRGWQDERRKWWVDRADLQRFISVRGRVPAAPAQ